MMEEELKVIEVETWGGAKPAVYRSKFAASAEQPGQDFVVTSSGRSEPIDLLAMHDCVALLGCRRCGSGGSAM